MDGGGRRRRLGVKKNLCMRYGQLGKCLKVGVCKELKYVEEMRVLSFLLTTNHPVPPLAVCRHQMISGPERSCKRKWEEIWSIWWHYKGRRWFAAFIKTWSRLHHLLMTRTLLSHLVTVHWMSHQSLSPAEPVICLTLGVRGSLQQSSKLILLWKVKSLQVGKFFEDFSCFAWINQHVPNFVCCLRYEDTGSICFPALAWGTVVSEQP